MAELKKRFLSKAKEKGTEHYFVGSVNGALSWLSQVEMPRITKGRKVDEETVL